MGKKQSGKPSTGAESRAMFSLITAVLLAIGAIAALIVRKRIKVPVLTTTTTRGDWGAPQSNKEEVANAITARKWAGWVAVVLLILTVPVLFFGTFYTQDPGEAKVLRSFTGEVIGSDTTEGASFKAPWTSLVNYDIRNQVVDYVGDGTGVNETTNERVTGPAITAQDKDGATATIDIVVRYSINPSAVTDIYRQYQSQQNFVSRLVENDIRSVVRNIPLQYHTSEFRLKREEAAGKMAEALTARWASEGLIVDAVDLRDIRYPDNIEQSLQEVQVAQNNANRAIAELEAARVTAERTRVDAQAQADADQIIRCGAQTLQVEEMINGQTVTTTKTVPLDGAQCQNRLNEQVLLAKYIDMLTKAAAEGNTVYVIPPEANALLQLSQN